VLEDLRLAAEGGDNVRRPGKAPEPTRRLAAFIISPIVRFDRTPTSSRTIIEVSGRDRPGLLHDIARELTAAGLSIRSAHVGAYGERVYDVFYVEPLPGVAAVSDDATLTKALEHVLRANSPKDLRIPARVLARAPASTDR
jgi:[protein-PII] uridylyltransferase